MICELEADANTTLLALGTSLLAPPPGGWLAVVVEEISALFAFNFLIAQRHQYRFKRVPAKRQLRGHKTENFSLLGLSTTRTQFARLAVAEAS